MAEKILNNLNNEEEDFLKNLEEKNDDSEEKAGNGNIEGYEEEIWRVVEESDNISKEDFVFLEKNPDIIQKIAAGKEYETLLDKFDKGITNEKMYYEILIDFVKKEISYKKLKIKSETHGLKNEIWEKITGLSDVGKIKITDYEIIENNKDIFDDYVTENYEKIRSIKDDEFENKVLEIIAKILNKIKEKEKAADVKIETEEKMGKKIEIAGGKKEIEADSTERIRKLKKEIEDYSLIYEIEIKNSELASQELKKEIFEGLEKYKREVEELKAGLK